LYFAVSALDRSSLLGKNRQEPGQLTAKNSKIRMADPFQAHDQAFDLIRDHKLLQTTSEHFLNVLNKGSVATNVFLRRAHNFAIGMHWLPWPVLPKIAMAARHLQREEGDHD